MGAPADQLRFINDHRFYAQRVRIILPRTARMGWNMQAARAQSFG
jgi:hypothetical protein